MSMSDLVTLELLELSELIRKQTLKELRENEETLLLSQEYYKSHVLSDYIVKKREDFVHQYTSYEMIPFDQCMILRDVLRYLCNNRQLKLQKIDLEKISKNYNVIQGVMNGLQEGSYHFTETTISSDPILMLKYNMEYGYTKQHKVGRIYSKTSSFNLLSREFRHHLTKYVYTDIDIVNAHPSFLFEYAKSNNIPVSVLKELVTDRDNVTEKVKSDYTSFKAFNAKDTKRLILSVLNMTKDSFLSETLNELN